MIKINRTEFVYHLNAVIKGSFFYFDKSYTFGNRKLSTVLQKSNEYEGGHIEPCDNVVSLMLQTLSTLEICIIFTA